MNDVNALREREREQNGNNNSPNNFNWTPWLIGAAVLVVIGLGIWLFIKNKKDK